MLVSYVSFRDFLKNLLWELRDAMAIEAWITRTKTPSPLGRHRRRGGTGPPKGLKGAGREAEQKPKTTGEGEMMAMKGFHDDDGDDGC